MKTNLYFYRKYNKINLNIRLLIVADPGFLFRRGAERGQFYKGTFI